MTQRQVPDARNGLRGGQSANPDSIAEIDSNQRGSRIAFATFTVIQNPRRAFSIQRELAFLQPAHYMRNFCRRLECDRIQVHRPGG